LYSGKTSYPRKQLDQTIHKSKSSTSPMIPMSADDPHEREGDLVKQTYGGFHRPHLDFLPGHRPIFNMLLRRDVGAQ